MNSKVALHDRYPEYMPRQAVCKDSSELIAFANAVGYPSGECKLCCKLADEDGAGGIGFSIIDEEKWMDMELWGRVEKEHYTFFPFLCQTIDNGQHEVIVQEYIEGRDYNTVLLADHGRVVSICGFSGNGMDCGAVQAAKALGARIIDLGGRMYGPMNPKLAAQFDCEIPTFQDC